MLSCEKFEKGSLSVYYFPKIITLSLSTKSYCMREETYVSSPAKLDKMNLSS
jgi:hypothetical protein